MLSECYRINDKLTSGKCIDFKVSTEHGLSSWRTGHILQSADSWPIKRNIFSCNNENSIEIITKIFCNLRIPYWDTTLRP